MSAPRSTFNAIPVLCQEDGTLSLCFEDGNVQSRMSIAEPTRLMLEYTRLMMACLLFHPTPQRMAMIGLGGGSLAKYCHARLPESDLTVVEISPAVIRLRPQFAIPADGPRFRVVCADGADYVHAAPGGLDVLFVDAFEAGGQPERVGTASFYEDCANRLGANALLVVNLHADDDDYGTYVRRIHNAFDGAVVVLNADDSENRVAFASAAKSFPPSRDQLIERLRRLEPHHPIGLEVAARKIIEYAAAQSKRRRRRAIA